MARLTMALLEYRDFLNSPPPKLDLRYGGIPGYCPPELITKFEEEEKHKKETSEPKVPSL